MGAASVVDELSILSEWPRRGKVGVPTLVAEFETSSATGSVDRELGHNLRLHPMTTFVRGKPAAHLRLGSGFFLTSCTPRTLLTPITSIDDVLNIPAAGRARCRPSNVRCIYPGFRHCDRHLRRSAGSNRLWFRYNPPDHDSGTFSSHFAKTTLTYVYEGHDGQL
jgi:hypothetical protein